MLLFFDTETTGFTKEHLPVSHPSQPHLVQLAALLTEDDGRMRSTLNVIVKPNGYEIPEDASRVHGITTEIAHRCGIPLALAVTTFSQLLMNAAKRIAHNNTFDDLVMTVAGQRSGIQELETFLNQQPVYCTMRAATPILKIPSPKARHAQDYKWPNLGQCFQHFTGKALDGAHNAIVDVRACRAVYFAMNPNERQQGADQ
jgi:DNA polymerase III subunit epsilon